MKVDIRSLPSVAFCDKKRLPKSAGIYLALTAKSLLLYVGASRNLHQRWNVGGHHRYHDLHEHGCLKLAWILVKEAELAKLESQLIRQLRPLLNVIPMNREPADTAHMNNRKRLTEADARLLLENAVCEAGSQAVFADSNKVSRQHLGDVLKGRREIAGRVLKALGLVKIVEYERKKGRKR